MKFYTVRRCASLLALSVFTLAPAFAQSGAPDRQHDQPQDQAQKQPWMNPALSPDKRADLVVAQMTLDEKIQMVHGSGWGALRPGAPILPGNNLGAGFTPGIDRLGIPGINMADSAVGARMAAMESRYATLLPSTLGAAASWDPAGALLYGQVIGRELRAEGYNMSIGGGVDLTREPRNGRNFEYAGEDPVLAGTMVGTLEKGVQSQQIMNDIKHYAMNDQETGRNILNAIIDKRAMRETDLLAFQIAIGIADPSGVMCSYNKVNGTYSCENDYLLNQVLKKDWDFKGFVLSDWGGTHSTVKAAMAGLDQEQPEDKYFGEPLKEAVQNGQVPMPRLDDMVHRILRSMFAAGVIDHLSLPRSVVDPFQGRDDAQHIAEESIVLLKNSDNLLPLSASVHSIAIIGSHADKGVLSGGGSAQVDAPGGNVIDPQPGVSKWGEPVYFPSSPLKYISLKAPNAKVKYAEGTDSGAAVVLAKSSEVAVVFVNQPMREGQDAASLSLPGNQDALVEAVAKANPHTIVVLETGGPVTMPWAGQVAGIVEAWYPGIGGAQALANILFGDVNPSAHLPLTFAKSDADLPHPKVIGIELKPVEAPTMPEAAGGSKAQAHHHDREYPPFDVDYTEGMRFGYRWFESEHIEPLFAFGYGLSYTTFEFSGISASRHNVSFTVRNSGNRAGTEVAQVYAQLPANAGEPFKRLVAFDRVTLAPGQARHITLPLDPTYMSIFNVDRNRFELLPGDYKLLVGGSSNATPLATTLHLGE